MDLSSLWSEGKGGKAPPLMSLWWYLWSFSRGHSYPLTSQTSGKLYLFFPGNNLCTDKCCSFWILSRCSLSESTWQSMPHSNVCSWRLLWFLLLALQNGLPLPSIQYSAELDRYTHRHTDTHRERQTHTRIQRDIHRDEQTDRHT